MARYNPYTGQIEDESLDLLRRPTDIGVIDDSQSIVTIPPIKPTVSPRKPATVDPLEDLEDIGYEPPDQEAMNAPGYQAAAKYLKNSEPLSAEMQKNLLADYQSRKTPQPLVGRNPAETMGTLPQNAVQPPLQLGAEPEAQKSELKSKEAILEEYQRLMREKNGTNKRLDVQLGVNQILQGMASGYGAKIGDGSESLNQLRKTADQLPEALLNAQKFEGEQAKLIQLLEKTDPNTNLAGLQRNVVEKLAKDIDMDVGDLTNISAENLNEIMRSLSYIQNNKNNQDLRKDTKEEKVAKDKLDRDDKLKKESTISDKQASDIASFDAAISALDDIITQKPNYDTGKLSFSQNLVGNFFGLDDSKKSAFKSDVGEQLASYIKSISGATVSPTERAALLENVPSVYDNDDTFMSKANALKKRLSRNKQIELDVLFKKGKDVDQYGYAPASAPINKDNQKTIVKQQYSASRNQTRLIYSDGSEEIKDGK